MLGGPSISFFHERTQSSRRGVENIDLVLRHNFPETTEVGIVGDALEHDTGGPVGQGTVHDIAVTGYPADVSRTPIDITWPIVEDVFVSHGYMDKVPPG